METMADLHTDNDKQNVFVSVICITYNPEKYVRQCLEGILSQKTSFTFEVIVHDDASTDNTSEIIREYEKKVTVQSAQC